MKNLIIVLEATTPLVIGGIDPRNKAELRAPSFRGSFRWWTRALIGGWLGDPNNRKDLAKAESAIWGSTDTASAIRTHITHEKISFERKHILPHKRQASKPAIASGSTFWLELSARSTVPEVVWDAAVIAAITALTLGGVGNRSRRGFGSCKILQSKENDYITPVEESEWPGYIERLVGRAHNATKQLLDYLEIGRREKLPGGISKYPHFNQQTGIFLTEPIANTSEDALSTLMTAPRLPKRFDLGRALGGRQGSAVWIKPVQMNYGSLQKWGLLYTLFATEIHHQVNYQEVAAYLINQAGANTVIPPEGAV